MLFPHYAKVIIPMAKALRPVKSVSIYALVTLLLGLFLVGGLPQPGVNYSDLYREAIAEIGLVGLLFYWFYNNRYVQKITLTFSATRLWFLGLFLLATISVFWAVNIEFFISKYLLWLSVAAIFWLTLTLPSNTKIPIIIARVLLLSALYIAIIGLLQALLSMEIFSQAKPPAANFVNKNMATQVLVLIFPLGVFLLFADKHKYLSRVYPFVLALIVAYVFHTHTRTAWLSIILEISLIILGLILYRKALKKALQAQTIIWNKKQTLNVVLAVFLLLLLVNISAQGWSPFWDSFATQTSSIIKDVQSHGQAAEGVRYRIWDAALTMMIQSPLIGTGMGSFFHNLVTDSQNYLTYKALRVHNDLLELGVELGVIGLILLLGAVISLLLNLSKLITRGDIQQKLFYWLIAVALIGSALNMQFSFPYQMPAPLVIFGLYAALIIKSSDVYGLNIKTIDMTLKLRHWYIALAGIGVVFIVVIIMNFIWLNAMLKIDNNIKYSRWQNPIENSLVCHKTITKSLYDFSILYTKLQKYNLGLKSIESFAQCMPNTWLYENAKGLNLIKLHKYNEAINLLEKAKQHAPKGIYKNHVNQFIAYMNANKVQAAFKVYQQLATKPQSLLAKRPKTLKNLTLMALKFKDIKQAKKFYNLYSKHYENVKFKAQVGKLIDNFTKEPLN